MDLNRLYFDHQLLLMQAEREPCPDRRLLHRHGAALIAGRIGCMQVALGAQAAGGWANVAERNSDSTGLPPSLLAGPLPGPYDWRSAANGRAA